MREQHSDDSFDAVEADMESNRCVSAEEDEWVRRLRFYAETTADVGE